MPKHRAPVRPAALAGAYPQPAEVPAVCSICDIADFMEMCRMVGAPETFTKVGPLLLAHAVDGSSIFFARSDSSLVPMNIVSGFGYVGFLLRACDPSPLRTASRTAFWLRWKKSRRSSGSGVPLEATSLGPADWLRRKAYRAKEIFCAGCWCPAVSQAVGRPRRSGRSEESQ